MVAPWWCHGGHHGGYHGDAMVDAVVAPWWRHDGHHGDAMVGAMVAIHPWNRVNYTTWRCSNIIQIPYYNLTIHINSICFFNWDSEQRVCPNWRLSNNQT